MRIGRGLSAWLLAILLISGTAWSAPLISADVSIGAPINDGGTGKTPGYSTSGNFNCVVSCSYTFALAATNFEFTETCLSQFDEQPCTMPALVISLTNMAFSGGEILTNAVLTETDDINGGPFGSVVFTADSVTLTIASVLAFCGSQIATLVTFTTGLAPSSDVPEPSTIALLGAGIVALLWRRRQRPAAA